MIDTNAARKSEGKHEAQGVVDMRHHDIGNSANPMK
jgi:hypothetical protein